MLAAQSVPFSFQPSSSFCRRSAYSRPPIYSCCFCLSMTRSVVAIAPDRRSSCEPEQPVCVRVRLLHVLGPKRESGVDIHRFAHDFFICTFRSRFTPSNVTAGNANTDCIVMETKHDQTWNETKIMKINNENAADCQLSLTWRFFFQTDAYRQPKRWREKQWRCSF